MLTTKKLAHLRDAVGTHGLEHIAASNTDQSLQPILRKNQRRDLSELNLKLPNGNVDAARYDRSRYQRGFW
ncbi:hypothetical protein ACVWYQ_003225 [Bradyrhizobium sp. USDA 3397]